MDLNDLLVLFFALIITISGLAVNAIKHSKKSNIILSGDGSTLMWFRYLVSLSLVMGVFFSLSGIGHMNMPCIIRLLGGMFILAGLIFRWIAIISLGRYFTVDVVIAKDHKLITTGIFTYLRHPSYTGLILYDAGLGIIMNNWISLILMISLPTIAVLKRIYVEEKLLKEYFKEQYFEYMTRSWSILPFIF